MTAAMNQRDLQTELFVLGFYKGSLDGIFGPASRAAFVECLAAGPDTSLTDADYSAAADALRVTVPHIKALTKVEANGAGFQAGLPKILPEPHRFSKNTGHRYDATYPSLSYPTWDPSKYPRTQQARWDQLSRMVSLDVDAGLKSASYGAFQIMGENFLACGYVTPWEMVHAASFTEGDQLREFVTFMQHEGIVAPLRAGNWAEVARRYNGTAYRQNHYDTRLAAAYHAAGGQ